MPQPQYKEHFTQIKLGLTHVYNTAFTFGKVVRVEGIRVGVEVLDVENGFLTALRTNAHHTCRMAQF